MCFCWHLDGGSLLMENTLYGYCFIHLWLLWAILKGCAFNRVEVVTPKWPRTTPVSEVIFRSSNVVFLKKVYRKYHNFISPNDNYQQIALPHQLLLSMICPERFNIWAILKAFPHAIINSTNIIDVRSSAVRLCLLEMNFMQPWNPLLQYLRWKKKGDKMEKETKCSVKTWSLASYMSHSPTHMNTPLEVCEVWRETFVKNTREKKNSRVESCVRIQREKMRGAWRRASHQ